MPWTFEVESIFKVREKVLVMARMLSSEEKGQLTDNSTLGLVRIEKWFDIPRALDAQDNIRNSLYAFCLKDDQDVHLLQVGQVVELIL